MKKNFSYRLFKFGAVPRKLLPILEQENIVVSDEGMSGKFITKNVKESGRRYLHRFERFSGCLVITKKRLLCYTFSKRQINISIYDPKILKIFYSVPEDNTLSISFESSVFHNGWSGVIEFQFKTDKTNQFVDELKSIGVRQGTPVKADTTQD